MDHIYEPRTIYVSAENVFPVEEPLIMTSRPKPSGKQFATSYIPFMTPKSSNSHISPYNPSYNPALVNSNPIGNEEGLRAILTLYGFTQPMQDYFVRKSSNIHMRYFMYCDNHAMDYMDAKRVVNNGRHIRVVNSTRWDELIESMNFHLETCQAGLMNSKFMKFNSHSYEVHSSMDSPPLLSSKFKCRESRQSNFDSLVIFMYNELESVRGFLKKSQKIVTLTICTCFTLISARPGTENVFRNLVKNNPISVTIRVCTQDTSILEWWKNFNRIHGLGMNIIAGYCDESVWVHSHNPWLCYTKAIHYMREFCMDELISLNTRSFWSSDIKVIGSIIYGRDINNNEDIAASPVREYCIVERRRREYITLPPMMGCVIC